MQLLYSHTSPYARKVRIVIEEKGAANDVTLVTVNPLESPAALTEKNPLSKVPALILESGDTLIDSPMICDYLDRTLPGRQMLPASSERTAVQQRHAVADGILDAAVSMVFEARRPDAEQSAMWMGRWRDAVNRSLVWCSGQPLKATDPDLGDISVAVALAYLDFRLPELAWAKTAPGLEAWFEEISARDSFQTTAPPQS